jgi:2-C-methyl-D-erythritol 2,4-cyclodiphosphate synthase
MKIKTGIGQDSHAFDNNGNKPLILGGIVFDNHKGLKANSDGDVIIHALINAIASVTGKNILGKKTDKLCKQGITDSSEYLKLALIDLDKWVIEHIAIAVECLNPKIIPKKHLIESKIANLVNTDINNVAITATTGEGLTSFGKGDGIQVFVIITVANYE